MMYASLGEFVAALEAAGELHRIKARVSPRLEISAIADWQAREPCPRTSEHARAFDPGHCDKGGKALLFEDVDGCDFPVLINAYGSYRRTEMALGCEDGGFGAIAARIGALAKPEPPKSLGAALKKGRELLPLLRIPPKRLRSGRCQEIVRLATRGEIDLFTLPLIQCWPLDGDPTAVGYDVTAEQAGTAAGQGRYVTFAGVHTIHADDEGEAKPSSHNIGMYRLQLVDKTHLAMHWHMHHDGATHWRSWKRKDKPMPVAICLGGGSVMPYAATAPLPPGLSELLMAGFLNGRGIPLVRGKTVPLWVPAESEIVIEGYVSPECGFPGYDPRTGELGPGAVFEGPFGDHTGFYSLPDRYPLVNVTAITHRSGAIYPTTIVGLPPQEDYYLGKATERIFLPLLQTLIFDIVDYHLPLFGCFHNCAFVKIRKEYPLQARRVMCSVWGAGQMAWTKVVVVVDDDVDVHDEKAVWRAVCENCDFLRDIEIVNGPLDILDHAAPRLGAGHKLGLDATRKIEGEEVNGVPVTETPAARTAPDLRGIVFPGFGLGRLAFVGVPADKSGGGAGAAIEHAWNEAGADLVIAVDASVDMADGDAVFFHWCANFDPVRDLYRDGHRLGFDATPKRAGDGRHGQPVREWPPLIAMTDEMKQRIAGRRSEYGL